MTVMSFSASVAMKFKATIPWITFEGQLASRVYPYSLTDAGDFIGVDTSVRDLVICALEVWSIKGKLRV